jgi:predicted O-methyltransferase YrrM
MNLELLKYIKHNGIAYNTEDSSLFFYALTKMKHYKRFVEFGTGLGCTSLAVASAMKENGGGKCITFSFIADATASEVHPRPVPNSTNLL